MLKINILCVGKIKESYLKDAINEYSKRLSKYCNLNFIELQDSPLPEKSNEILESQIKDLESENLLKHIPKGSYTICLDLTRKKLLFRRIC